MSDDVRVSVAASSTLVRISASRPVDSSFSLGPQLLIRIHYASQGPIVSQRYASRSVKALPHRPQYFFDYFSSGRATCPSFHQYRGSRRIAQTSDEKAADDPINSYRVYASGRAINRREPRAGIDGSRSILGTIRSAVGLVRAPSMMSVDAKNVLERIVSAFALA